jgi:hypothetical protein
MIALELKKLPEFASSELPALFPKVRELLKPAEKEFPQRLKSMCNTPSRA